MERVLVVSDTHGRVDNVIRLMENVPFDKIIHLGDTVRDALVIGKAFPDTELIYVRGNNDPFGASAESVIEISDKKIFICHGHTYSVSSDLLRISLAAAEKGATLALFGHTHRSVLERREDGFIILNPGSVSKPRGCRPSFAVLETENGKLKAVIVDWVL